MKQNKILNKFNKDGFVVIKNFFNKNQIQEILYELEKVKTKVTKLSNNFYHKTKNGKFNTIHNIQTFISRGKIIDISKSLKIRNLARLILKDNPQLRNIEFF